ncbi:hypothetical protein BDB01DRAFT_709320, partial [Pilobolus umbonatus]
DSTEDAMHQVKDMLPIAQTFYQQLYSKDEVTDININSYLDELSSIPVLSREDQITLTGPIRLEEILCGTRKVVSKQSSPGEDVLGYAFLYHLFRYPPLQDMIVSL